MDMPTADVLLPCCQPGVDRIRTSCVVSLPQARATGRMAPPALQGGIQANDLRAFVTLMYALQGCVPVNDLGAFDIDVCTSRVHLSK